MRIERNPSNDNPKPLIPENKSSEKNLGKRALECKNTPPELRKSLKKRKVERCFDCNRKLPLYRTMIKCKYCLNTYCGKHHCASDHNCDKIEEHNQKEKIKKLGSLKGEGPKPKRWGHNYGGAPPSNASF